MKTNDSRGSSRRRFLTMAGASVALLPFTGLVRVQTVGAAEMPKLTLDDPSAKALGYVNESAVADQHCINCNFWQGGGAEWGGCPLFPGKSVAAKGWCKSWLKKAS
jgi:hypothetical protein